jgi:hypothetical protein
MREDAPARIDRATGVVLAATVAAGLGLRLLHLHAVLPIVGTEGAAVGMDRWLNTEVASAIARGQWDGGWAVAYDSSPAYSYLLAALYAVSGGWTAALVFQLVLGALVPLLIFDVGRRLYGPATGLLAAVLAALHVPAIFYESLLVKFGLVPVVTAAALLGAVRLRGSGTVLAAVASGLALGALALLRPNTVLMAPVALAWALVGHPLRSRVRALAAAAAGAALLLAPMAVRDRLAAAHGLAGSLWGIHFYVGNSARADGEYVIVPGVRADPVGHVIDARAVAERRTGRTLSAEEVSWYWFRRGIRFARTHPGRWLALQGRKVWLTFAAGERGSFGDEFGELATASPVLRLPLVGFGVLGPLGLLGIVTTLRRRGPALLPLVVGAIAVSLLPFFVVGRYRLPLVAPMTILAAAGVVALAGFIGARARPLVAWLAAAAALAGLAVALGADDGDVAALLAVLAVGVPVAREIERGAQRPT